MGRYKDIQSDLDFEYGNNGFHININEEEITISSINKEFKIDGEVKANYSLSSFEEAGLDTVVIKKWLEDVKSELQQKIEDVEEKGVDDKKEILEKLDKEIKLVNDAIDVLDSNIKNIDNRLTIAEKKIEDIPEDVKEISEIVKSHEVKINSLEKELSKTNQNVENTNKEIININNSISNIVNSISNISKITIKNSNDIKTLRYEVDKILIDLTRVDKESKFRDNYLQNEIVDLYKIANDLDKRVKELEKHKPIPPGPGPVPPPVPPVPPPVPPIPPKPSDFEPPKFEFHSQWEDIYNDLNEQFSKLDKYSTDYYELKKRVDFAHSNMLYEEKEAKEKYNEMLKKNYKEYLKYVKIYSKIFSNVEIKSQTQEEEMYYRLFEEFGGFELAEKDDEYSKSLLEWLLYKITMEDKKFFKKYYEFSYSFFRRMRKEKLGIHCGCVCK